MTGDLNLLGPAEQHIVKKLRSSFEVSAEKLQRTAKALELLSETDFEQSLLDADKKQAVVSLLEIVEKLPAMADDLQLMAMVSAAMFNPEILRELG